MKRNDETLLITAAFDALNGGTRATAERHLDRFIREPPPSRNRLDAMQRMFKKSDDAETYRLIAESDDAGRVHLALESDDTETYHLILESDDAAKFLSEAWEAWWEDEREDAIRALRYLVKHGRLHPDDAGAYIKLVKQHTVVDPKFTQRDKGRVLVELDMKFHGPSVVIGYALLQLSNRHYRIIACPAPRPGERSAKCDRLVLELDHHVGHPKRFCSSKCRHRFNQRRSRSRRKKGE